jgi:RNA polymerase sigma-70 factor (ECF subfamily)
MNDWKTLIQHVQTGDYGALESVYVKYRSEFFRWIYKQYSCSYDDIQDIYQQSILVLYENIVNGKVSNFNSSIKTYLFAVGKNKYYELTRDKHKQLVSIKDNVQNESISETIDNEYYDYSNLHQCLQDLGQPCKDILELYYYHKLSMQDIADKIGLKNADTAKNMKYKCLKRLKVLYAKIQAKCS